MSFSMFKMWYKEDKGMTDIDYEGTNECIGHD